MSEWFKDTRTMSDDEVLLDYAQRLGRYRTGWIAVELHVALLRAHHQRPQHLRIIVKAFEPLVKKYDAALYRIHNNNVVVLVKGASIADIDAGVLQVKYLFSEDPLLSAQNVGPGGEEEFCRWYHLATDYDAFLARVLLINDDRQRMLSAASHAQRQIEELAPAGAMLDPNHLQILERSIARADLANVLRRQEVCAVVPGSRPEPIFHEIYFSMRYLAETILPGYDVTSDKWLFQHLSHVLDQRMLALIGQREYRKLLRYSSLNLTVGTVLGRDFLEFDRVTNLKDRGMMSIELPSIDVFSEPGDYLFARDFLKERGYKLTIDGLPHLMLPLLDRQLLGFDLIKILWTPALVDHVEGRHGQPLLEAVERIGRERIILCRVDSEQAFKVGEILGLSLYQGRLIDNMLQVKPVEAGRPGLASR